MICKVADIAREVRVCLDQNNTSGRLLDFGDTDTLSLEEVIRSKIEEGARRAHAEAPVGLLDSGHNFGDAPYWDTLDSGWVLLPPDFMRLIAFRMSDWERTVRAAMTEDDPLYLKRSSRYKGIRGNPQRPACAIVTRPEGRALEFYSCSGPDAHVERGVYLPYPVIDRDGGIEICGRVRAATVYKTAALVRAAYGDADGCAAFNELAQTALI